MDSVVSLLSWRGAQCSSLSAHYMCVCVCIVCVGAIGILVVTLDLGIVLAVQCCWLQQMCNMYM